MLPTTRCRVATIVVSVMAFARCTGASGPSLEPCASAVALSVSGSLEPTLSWSPNCLVDQVAVQEVLPPSVGGSQPRWLIRARNAGQGVAAPLRYGDVPARMEEVLTATPLEVGHPYRFQIYGGTMVVGERQFTYWPPD